MTSRDFCFWLQGYFELQHPHELNHDQIKTIMRHLNMVFVHEIDPSMPNKKLDAIHAQATDSTNITMRC